MASQAYISPDFYYARASCDAGESPTTHASQWQALAIPADFKSPVALMAAAALLEGQARFDDAINVRQQAVGLLATRIHQASLRENVVRQLKVTNTN
jgi:hypothetical protein